MVNSSNLLKAKDLVDQYLALLKKKNELEQEFLGLKQKIADFSKTSKLKTLKSDNVFLYVSLKQKTVFPNQGEEGRKQVEEIMKNSKEWNQVITFDVIKLGEAYDKKKLSLGLRKKLEPYASKEEKIRLYAKDISGEKNIIRKDE